MFVQLKRPGWKGALIHRCSIFTLAHRNLVYVGESIRYGAEPARFLHLFSLTHSLGEAWIGTIFSAWRLFPQAELTWSFGIKDKIIATHTRIEVHRFPDSTKM